MAVERDKTCCFTGHRRLPADRIGAIVKQLNHEVDRLIAMGVTDFISGGALGFDQIAASLIIAKKQMGNPIRLIFALPCRDQDATWSAGQKKLYHGLLYETDEIIYVSEDYDSNCMKKRNFYMVDQSAYCICALLHEKSGTAQTVRYAIKSSIRVINIFCS